MSYIPDYNPSLDMAIDSLNGINRANLAMLRKFDAKYQSQYQSVYEDVIDYLEQDGPFVHELLYSLSCIEDVSTRLDILDDMRAEIPLIFQKKNKDREYIKQIEKEYEALRHYVYVLYDIVRSDEIKNTYSSRFDAERNSLRLDAMLYHYMLEHGSYYEEFLWYSQAIYYYAHENQEHIEIDSNHLPIYSYLFKDHLIFPSVFFCYSLLEAAQFRRKIIGGIDKPFTVKEFPLKLRNFCFDAYIKKRTQTILDELKKDFDRPFEANEAEAQEELLRQEELVYEKAALDSDFSADVVRMCELFIEYLKDRIGIANDDEDENHNSNIVTGDGIMSLLEVKKRIKVVYKAQICKKQADWGTIMKILVELEKCADTNYSAAAKIINSACGKEVTSPDALRQSQMMKTITGTFKEGWTDRARTRQSANLLLHYNDIAEMFFAKK